VDEAFEVDEVKGTKMSVKTDACRSGFGTSSMFSRRLAAFGNVPVPSIPSMLPTLNFP
jgi:hypothetical protein